MPKTFPGVGTRLVWIFDDPRAEDVPEEEMLSTVREIRDEIEQKILDWLVHPENELVKLREERERRERLEAAQREAESRNAFAAHEIDRAYLGSSMVVPERTTTTLA